MSYLEQLKAKISEKPHPRLLTKPTKAPSVSFVSAPGCHVLKNAQEEDPPAQYWSDVVQERFWVAPSAAQASALAAQGQVAYQPDEIWHLRDLKARDLHTFPEKLRAVHQAKSIFGATVTHEAPPTTGRTAGRAARERPAKPRDPRLGPILPPCATCGDIRYWHEHETDSWHCWTCTPPPPRRPSPEIFFSAPVEVEVDEVAMLTPERALPLPRSPAPCWRCKGPSERQGLYYLLCATCLAQELQGEPHHDA